MDPKVPMDKNQKIGLIIVGFVFVAVSAWYASSYFYETNQIRSQNATLIKEHAAELAKRDVEKTDLLKEIARLQAQLQQVRPGWRPGAPIGSTPDGVGATPETQTETDKP